jgi:hypothetical protein
MHRMIRQCLLIGACASTLFSQSPQPDDELLAKTRSLYDAPFIRDLASFDCAVEFDWKKHFIETLGAIPPAAASTLDRLQEIQHRVVVNRSGAHVSAIPNAPNLADVPHGPELEQAITAVSTGGLNAWVPFGANLILPLKPSESRFEKMEDGYTVKMSGDGVEGVLRLTPDLRLVSGVSRSQSFQFATKFVDGPQGLLLQEIQTEPISNDGSGGKSNFSFVFQDVDGFELPSEVTVTQPIGEVWRVGFTDCKVTRGPTINVAPPPKL